MSIHTCGNVIVDNIVQFPVVHLSLTETNNEHTTSNIHTDQIRNNEVAEISSKTNDTTRSGVNIGHDCNPAVFRKRLITKLLDLNFCGFFNEVSINIGRVVLTNDCFHNNPLFLLIILSLLIFVVLFFEGGNIRKASLLCIQPA